MSRSRAADDFDFIKDRLKKLDTVEGTSTTQQPTKERPRAVEDVEVIKKRIEELRKEQDAGLSGTALASIGNCFSCQQNSAMCGGSCEW